MIYWQIAFVFAILSLLGFGGGNAIIPQMHEDVVNHYHWITSAEFARIYGLARISPGPNTLLSALVGYAVAGLLGAVVATIAVFVPVSILVGTAGHIWKRMRDNVWRERFAKAIRPVVLGLIWAGCYTLARGAADAPITIAMMVLGVILLLRTSWSPALMVISAGVFGGFVLH